MKSRIISGSAAALFLSICGLAGPPAHAATASIYEIDVTSSQYEQSYGTDLTITLSYPETPADAQQTVSQLTAGDYSSPRVQGDVYTAKTGKLFVVHGSIAATKAPKNRPKPPATGSNGYANFHCDRNYHWTDSDGRFAAQRACGTSSATWHYNIAPPLIAICSSLAHEEGMEWAVNAIPRHMTSPHVEPCEYTFHGTWTNVHFHDYLWYTDAYNFTVQVAGHEGDAEIDVHGGLYFLASGT